jgi:hypothetical protein
MIHNIKDKIMHYWSDHKVGMIVIAVAVIIIITIV